ncbi:uncharacterized protein LOC131249990 [Magnolia sinica]|uniref:uncharacterized protein LOC131249990 n=1 Tax=Magnolia sinica TaxID=86752 RepID=UPI0026598358|nr:uncharacterized protein LOC131249990 [Magnolia sinica]
MCGPMHACGRHDLQEELRPFFSLPKVMDGLFSLAKMLFDINIESADGLAPWLEQAADPCQEVVIISLLVVRYTMLEIRFHMQQMGQATGFFHFCSGVIHKMHLVPFD